MGVTGFDCGWDAPAADGWDWEIAVYCGMCSLGRWSLVRADAGFGWVEVALGVGRDARVGAGSGWIEVVLEGVGGLFGMWSRPSSGSLVCGDGWVH